jgi:hypothetical protein
MFAASQSKIQKPHKQEMFYKSCLLVFCMIKKLQFFRNFAAVFAIFIFSLQAQNASLSSGFKTTKSLQMGEIIFIYGTSTAGKSSICNALKKIRPDWVFENADDIFEDTLKFILKVENPKYFEVINKAIDEKNIFTSSTFLRGVYLFKKSSTPEQQQEAVRLIKKLQQTHPLLKIDIAWEQAELTLFRRGFEFSKRGKTVVLDSVCPELLLRYKAQQQLLNPIRFICVVCPFSKLAERLLNRNISAEQTGELKEARYGFFPLTNWKKLYKPQTSPSEVVVDKIDSHAVLQALNAVKEFVEKRKGPQNTDLKREDDACVENPSQFLKELGFSSTRPTISFVPRFSFDQLIITSELTPEEAANKIASAKIKHLS